MESLNERLLFWMKKRDNIGQKTLALKAGLNETAVRDILKGLSQSPRIDTILKLCRALECLPHDLVPELKEMYPPEADEFLTAISSVYEGKRKLMTETLNQNAGKSKK